MNVPHRLAPARPCLAGALSLAAPIAPAGAAPVPCVRTITGSGAVVAPDADGVELTTTAVPRWTRPPLRVRWRTST